MGNHSSKKSKSTEGDSNKFIFFRKKMDKDKVAPLINKLSVASKGFNKKRPPSALPVPVTLTSRNTIAKADDASGSSVESLCNKSDITKVNKETNTPSHHSLLSNGAINRFGFRSMTPPKYNKDKESFAAVGRSAKKSPASSRSKSEGPREAFFKQLTQPAGSVQSIVNFPPPNAINNVMHPGKFTLQSSHLPRPQFAVRVNEKSIKTAANTFQRNSSKFVSQDSGFGESSDASDSRPGVLSKYSRPMPGQKLELKVVGNNRFEVYKSSAKEGLSLNLKCPSNSVSTGLVQKRTEQYLRRLAVPSFKETSPSSSVPLQLSVESEEEKLKEDSKTSEKFIFNDGLGENDEMLPGETMADDIPLSINSDEEEISERDSRTTKNVLDSKLSFVIKADALRLSNQLKKTLEEMPKAINNTAEGDDSIYDILTSEDRENLLKDSNLLDMLSSLSDSFEINKNVGSEKSPIQANGSPGTPSRASLSEGSRDFLIDDEIADQPELCFSTHEEVGLDKLMTSSNNCVNISPKQTSPVLNSKAKDDLSVSQDHHRRRNSVDTLSPCDSLMSDDLIMDYESDGRYEELNDNNVDSHVNGLLNDWANLSRQKDCNGSKGLPVRNGVTLASPTMLKSESPRRASEEEGSFKIDRSSYQNIFEDIVSIKSMLLRLNRLLSEDENEIIENEKDDSCGVIELRKQVACLQEQLKQRENMVQLLQIEVNKALEGSQKLSSNAPTHCNAATQTDRIRPTSTGPFMSQQLSSTDSKLLSNGFHHKSIESSKLAHNECDKQSSRSGSISKKEDLVRHSDNNGLRSAPADKILEKVKALSFKPVEVLEREKENAIQGKNVYKITKIDLVLKSDNYGRTELRKS